jgi:hypothetical protein
MTLRDAFDIIFYTLAAVYLFFLPGDALLRILFPRPALPWMHRIGLAAGLSLSLYPLLFLWAYLFGLRVGPLLAWGPGAAGLAVWVWAQRSRLRQPPTAALPANFTWGDAALIALSAALLLSRLLPIRGMIAPAWGDSVHHTLIVRLILEHNGLFQSWGPYAPLETFSYHFGLHANMAAFAWVTGLPVTRAVLVAGQLLNVLAVLALYPIASRLGGSRVAGLFAVALAGLVSEVPGEYVNWGRYTQLAAQVILPGWLWALDVWWTEQERPSLRVLGLLGLLSAGVALAHYRVAVVAVFAAIGWGLWALWLLRGRLREWLARAVLLAGAGGTALAAVLPWIVIARSSELAGLTGALAQRSTDAAEVRDELTVWQSVDAYYPPALRIGVLGAAALALWRRRQLAVPVLLWSVGAFFASSPFLLGLAGTGVVTNFLLALGLYIPLSLAGGWLLAEVWRVAGAWRPRPNAPILRWIAAAALLWPGITGLRNQLAIVDPFYQMVTGADETTLAWADQHTPPDSRFLVNGFLAYNDSLVVGSDAGWWLPYYTARATNVPPILYSIEQLSPGVDPAALRQMVIDLRAGQGKPDVLRAILCRESITHIFLGDRQGQTGFGDTQLIPPAWLQDNADFTLLHQSGNAQIWAFDRSACVASPE